MKIITQENNDNEIQKLITEANKNPPYFREGVSDFLKIILGLIYTMLLILFTIQGWRISDNILEALQYPAGWFGLGFSIYLFYRYLKSSR